MDNILFIPGIANPVAEIRQLLFGAGQPGLAALPTYSQAMIAANSFGSGVTDILDLSGRNNPFSQATPSSRGAWFREPKRGRVNLLERTQEFENAYWVKTNTTVTQNTTAAPDGSLTGDTVLGSAGVTNVIRAQDVVATATTYVFTLFCRAGTATSLAALLQDSTTSTVLGVTASVLSGPGSVAIAGNVVSVTGLSATSWSRISLVLTSAMTAGNSLRCLIYPEFFSGPSNTGKSVILWGAQLETGSTATAYQRVTTAFDVTEQGQRDCYGVRLDGIDDWHISGNIGLSSIDKATVFVAVRKRSDALQAQLLQFPDTGLNAFHIEAPASTLNDYRGFHLGNTTARGAAITQAAPDVAILTMQCDLGAPLVSLRRNGGTAATNALSTGGGNFKNVALRVGSNAGTTRFFNGDVFAIIMAGGSYPLSTIQRVERLLSRITPTVNL